MASTCKPSFSTMLFLLLFFLPTTSGVPNTNVKTLLCNGQTYTSGDPFAASLAYVLADLESATPARKGHDYYDVSPFPNAFAYGHATCTAKLTEADCSTCLVAAQKQMVDTCGMSIGARCVLVDCSIRYEQYPFTF